MVKGTKIPASKRTRQRRKNRNGMNRGMTQAVTGLNPVIASNNSKPFPDEVHVSLSYTETFNFSSSTLALVVQTYLVNSAYDPNFSGVGAQPVAYDQWSNFYNRYMIDTGSLDVLLVNRSGSPIVCGVMLDIDSSVPTALNTFLNNPRTRYNVLPSNAQIPARFFMPFNVSSVYGIPKIKANIEEWTGQTGNIGTGTDPARGLYAHVFVSNVDGTAIGTNSLQVIVRLVQQTKFFRRKELPLS